MKKILLICSFILTCSAGLVAQDQGDSRVHLLGSYGLRYNEFGVGAGWEYFFAEKFALFPNYTQHFPKVGNFGNFSTDLHYYFSTEKSQVYVLAGYSLNLINSQPGTAGTRQRQSGGNIGAGAVIEVTENIGIVSEFRFQSQGLRQPFLRLGLVLPL